MWVKHRLARLGSKYRNLKFYFKTLSKANKIERQTDWTNSRRPVLLLYGFGATRRSLSILESRLKTDGFDCFSINLGGFLELFNTDPIDRVAKKVAAKIESLCERYRIPRLSIIGYSKGGLIGRYYVSILEGHKRVHTLITLATPHQGNPWALLTNMLGLGLLSKGLRQMLPHSRFIKRLNKAAHPESVYMVSIASDQDRNSPPKYCGLPNAENGRPIFNVVLPNLYHTDFLLKQSAYQEITKHLHSGYSFFLQNGAGDEPRSRMRKAK